MAASPHTHSTTPPRGTEYCVDCYAVNGRVTVATRMFKNDALCERHYLALCKELEIEPEAKPAAKPADATISQPLTRRPEAGLKPAGHPVRESVAVRARSDVSRPESTEAHGGNQSAVVTTNLSVDEDVTAALGAQGYKLRDAERAVKQSYQPGDTFSAAFKKALDVLTLSRQIGRPVAIATSQRPDSSVAPAAEGLRDRAHSPTRPAPSQGSGVPQTPSAANPQPQARKEPTMAKCKCGCGEDLTPGTVRQFKMGHNSKQIDNLKRLCACGCGNPVRNRWDYIKGHNTESWLAARKAHDQQLPPVTATNGNGHAMPPVAIANGHAAPPIQMIARSVIAADGAYLVPCQVSEWAMDRIWLRLTPEEKAQLLFPAETEPAPAGAAHHA